MHVDFVRRPPRRSLEIVGEAGVLRWEYEEGRVLHYAPAIRQWRVEEVDRRFERNDMYLAELRHFVGCVRGEIERPRIDGKQGAAVLAIALAGLRSSATGRAIDLQAEGEPGATWLTSLGPLSELFRLDGRVALVRAGGAARASATARHCPGRARAGRYR